MFSVLLLVCRILASHLIDCVRGILAAYLRSKGLFLIIIPVLLLLSEAERSVVVVRGVAAAEHLNELRLCIVRHQLLSFHLLPLVGLDIALLELKHSRRCVVLTHRVSLILSDARPRDGWLNHLAS